MDRKSPSLYEILTGYFSGDLPLAAVNEDEQVILSVLDNIQRILNARAGSISHLPDYGLPDMTKILQGMPGTAHLLIETLNKVLLKYEPRLHSLNATLLEQQVPGELRYAICRALWCGAGTLWNRVYSGRQSDAQTFKTTTVSRKKQLYLNQ